MGRTATDEMVPIAEDVRKFQAKLAADAITGPQSEQEPKHCQLCEREFEYWIGIERSLCQRCESAVQRGVNFAGLYCPIPRRFRDASIGDELLPGKSYLLFGPPGIGKTYAGYALLASAKKLDPRLRVAAQYWPNLIMELRRGYGRNRGEDNPADELIDAMRDADIAFLDDIAAERVTDSNRDWLRETLGVIVDFRWAEMKTLIVTTNAGPESLPQYLGERIVSRILGLCEVVQMKGRDRRLDIGQAIFW